MTSCCCRPSFIWVSSSSSTSSSSTRGGSSTSNNRISKRTFVALGIRPLAVSHGRQFQQPSPPISKMTYANLFRIYSATPFHSPPHIPLLGNVDDGNGNNSNNNHNGGGDGWGWWWHEGGSSIPHLSLLLYAIFTGRRKRGFLSLLSVLGCFYHFQLLVPALARTAAADADADDKETKEIVKEDGTAWEVRGGKWTRLIPDPSKDEFVVAPGTSSSASATSAFSSPIGELWLKCRDICIRLMLPEGYPDSVTSDYLDYSLWRGVQGVASQISGVLATQSLLYAVGLGNGVIPTAAAINWVLKDGIGYLSKIFLSKYGRHFDVNPKGWRLFADLIENAAYGLEMLTPAFPHLFVPIGAAAGAGRSAAALIQAATRSCFYAGFAAQRNFAEVIAKGEAQGMVSKSIGIMLGIALANYIGSSTSLALVSFGLVTWVHMFCNLKSYQCIQLRTFNPYRASLVFSEYLLSGQVPPVKEVNDEEPLFPAVPFLNSMPGSKVESAVLSTEAKDAAAEIDRRLLLGAKLSIIVNNKQDALALFDLYRNEGYILTEHKGSYCVILKESCSPQDMLKSLFHANYLYWLDRNAGIKLKNAFDDCRPGGRLQISLDYVQREFNHVKDDWELAGWAADGLIARPSPTRIRPGFVATTTAS